MRVLLSTTWWLRVLAVAAFAAALVPARCALAGPDEVRSQSPLPAGASEPIRAAPGGGEMVEAGARFRHVTGATVDPAGRARVGCAREAPTPLPAGTSEAP